MLSELDITLGVFGFLWKFKLGSKLGSNTKMDSQQ